MERLDKFLSDIQLVSGRAEMRIHLDSATLEAALLCIMTSCSRSEPCPKSS